MANTFKNSIKGPAGTSGLSVYVCPSATSATVIGVNVANIVEQNIEIRDLSEDGNSSASKGSNGRGGKGRD